MTDDLLDALAVARLTRLVVDDTVLDRPRAWLLARAPDKVVEGATCYWCASVWVASVAYVARSHTPRLWRAVRWVAVGSLAAGSLADRA